MIDPMDVQFPNEPLDLLAKFSPPVLEPYSTSLLLNYIAAALADNVGSDALGMFASMLAGVGAALDDAIRIQPFANNQTHLLTGNVWVMLVAPPSSMKTPTLRMATAPLAKIEAGFDNAYRAECQAYEAQKRLARHGSTRTKSMAPPAPQTPLGPPPVRRSIIISDVTKEKLGQILVDNPRGVLLEADEAADLLEATRDLRKTLNRAYEANFVSQHRVARESIVGAGGSLSILGGVQTDLASENGRKLVNDGYHHRFIHVVMSPARRRTIGPAKQDHDPDDVDQCGAYEEYYNDIIQRVLSLKPAVILASANYHIDIETEIPVRFSPDAQEFYNKCCDELEEIAQIKGINPHVASFYGKISAILAKVCLLMHAVQNSQDRLIERIRPIINLDIVEDSFTIVDTYFCGHAWYYYESVVKSDPNTDTIHDVIDEILSKQLCRFTRSSFKDIDKSKFADVIETLMMAGWIAPEPRSSKAWVVNHSVHLKFAEEAVVRKANRDRRRKLLERNIQRGRLTPTT